MAARVLVIVPYPIPVPLFSGGQRGIYFPLKHLSRIESVYTYTLKENEFDFVERNYNEMSSGKTRYASLSMPIRLLQIIRNHQIEIVQFEHPYLAWVMLFLRLFTKVKVTMHSHNIEHVRFKQLGKKWWLFFKLYEKLAFQCAHLVLYKTQEDKQLACTTLNDCRENGTIIHYGVDMKELPRASELDQAINFVRSAHSLKEEKIILFNGSLSYLPNELAVKQIVNEINPLLKTKVNGYKILICGKGLSAELVQEIEGIPEIVYTGFVDDIDVYFKACDVFINPVVEGGGVKTKLIEALGFGKNSISYYSGSFGADITASNGRLQVVENYNAELFVHAIHQALQKTNNDDNSLFYTNYYWGNIAAHISAAQQTLIK